MPSNLMKYKNKKPSVENQKSNQAFVSGLDEEVMSSPAHIGI